jgi:hypothetical protein
MVRLIELLVASACGEGGSHTTTTATFAMTL